MKGNRYAVFASCADHTDDSMIKLPGEQIWLRLTIIPGVILEKKETCVDIVQLNNNDSYYYPRFWIFNTYQCKTVDQGIKLELRSVT